MFPIVFVFLLGLPILVFFLLVILDKKLSLSLSKFLRFCRFVVTSDVLVIVAAFLLMYLNEKYFHIHLPLPRRYEGDWTVSLTIGGIIISIGHIVGYLRYKHYAKNPGSTSGTLDKSPKLALVFGSLQLFSGFAIVGFIILAIINSSKYSHVPIVDATTSLYCLVIFSALLTALIQWRKQRTNTKNK